MKSLHVQGLESRLVPLIARSGTDPSIFTAALIFRWVEEGVGITYGEYFVKQRTPVKHWLIQITHAFYLNTSEDFCNVLFKQYCNKILKVTKFVKK